MDFVEQEEHIRAGKVYLAQVSLTGVAACCAEKERQTAHAATPLYAVDFGSFPWLVANKKLKSTSGLAVRWWTYTAGNMAHALGQRTSGSLLAFCSWPFQFA